MSGTGLDYISEAEALERWPFLSAHRLRLARKSGKLSWVRGKRGAPWYCEEDLAAYVKAELIKVGKCLEPEVQISSSLADTGSAERRGARVSTSAGTMKDLEESAVLDLQAMILKRPNSSSPSS
jgi:hypothetical protein